MTQMKIIAVPSILTFPHSVQYAFSYLPIPFQSYPFTRQYKGYTQLYIDKKVGICLRLGLLTKRGGTSMSSSMFMPIGLGDSDCVGDWPWKAFLS